MAIQTTNSITGDNLVLGYSPTGFLSEPVNGYSTSNHELSSIIHGISNKLGSFVSIKDFGAVGDGEADDTEAIRNAVSSGNTTIICPPGVYKITSSIEVPISLSLIGADTFVGGSTVFDCEEISGYLFLKNDVEFNGYDGFNVTGISFTGNRGTSWLGLLYSTAIAPHINISYCTVRDSHAIGAVALNLNNLFNVNIDCCKVFNFRYGMGLYAGPAGMTTITVHKTYFQTIRQIFQIEGITNIDFDNCIFEDSTVVGSVVGADVSFHQCYHESIGNTSGATYTGLVNKNFGLDEFDESLDVPVTSIYNFCSANVVFNCCRLWSLSADRHTSDPTSAWFFVSVILEANYASSLSLIDSPIRQQFSNEIVFEQNNYANQEYAQIFYQSGFQVYPVPYSMIDWVTDGYCSIYLETLGVGNRKAFCKIKNGRVFLSDTSYSVPTEAPYGRGWKTRDVIYPFTTSGYIGAICTGAGNPGTWKGFGLIA